MFCGGQPHSRDQCPARDQECNKCNKVGHWGKVCLSTEANNQANSSYRGRARGRGRGRPSYRSRGRGRGRSVHEMTTGSSARLDQMANDFESITFDAINTKQ
jgi:hypothetical protein